MIEKLSFLFAIEHYHIAWLLLVFCFLPSFPFLIWPLDGKLDIITILTFVVCTLFKNQILNITLNMMQ